MGPAPELAKRRGCRRRRHIYRYISVQLSAILDKACKTRFLDAGLCSISSYDYQASVQAKA